MGLDWVQAEKMQCSREEKEKVVPLIDLVVQAAEKAREEGLLALEEDVRENKEVAAWVEALLDRGELLMSWVVNLGSVLALVVLAEIVPKTVALAAPQRVVSVNLCSDQLLLMLANPAQVASVSFLSDFLRDVGNPRPR